MPHASARRPAVLKGVATLAWLLVLACGLYAVTAHTRESAGERYRLVEPPPLAALATPYLDLLMLGHRGLYDDFSTIWTLQILLDARLASSSADEVQEAVLAALRHHPKLETIYMVPCFVLALDLHRPDLCERITLYGLEAFPDSWRIPVTQGFMYAYRLNDSKRAALYYGLAASRPEAPAFLNSLTQKLISQNQLSIDELQATLDQLLGPDGKRQLSKVFERSHAPPRDGDQTAAPPITPAPLSTDSDLRGDLP